MPDSEISETNSHISWHSSRLKRVGRSLSAEKLQQQQTAMMKLSTCGLLEGSSVWQLDFAELADRSTTFFTGVYDDAYSSGLACVLYSFATHLARTLGFPGCPLSVSAHPVLMGAITVSRRQVSLETVVYILWRRMYSTSSRLALAYSSRSSHPLLLSSQCHPSHTLSNSCMDSPLCFARHSIFSSCCYHDLSRVSSLHLLFSSSVHESPALPGPLSTVLPLLERPGAPMSLFVPSRLRCSSWSERVDACSCLHFAVAPRHVSRW